MQVAFTPEDDDLRVSVLYRGMDKQISVDERQSYHKSVDVYQQPNAWADTDVSVSWTKNTLAPALKNQGEYVLFCDNLEGQCSASFQKGVRENWVILWYRLNNATDLSQPVDAGFGKILKSLVYQEQQDWLECDENIGLQLGNSEEKFNIKQQRILIPQLVGEAYKKTRGPDYEENAKCFEASGCFITSYRSDDHLIKLENLQGQVVTPPFPVELAPLWWIIGPMVNLNSF